MSMPDICPWLKQQYICIALVELMLWKWTVEKKSNLTNVNFIFFAEIHGIDTFQGGAL